MGQKRADKVLRIIPKNEYDRLFGILNSLGHVLEVVYVKDKDLMHLYAYTNTQLEVLRKDFGVNENANISLLEFVGRILFKNEKDFHWGAEFNDLNSFLTKL